MYGLVAMEVGTFTNGMAGTPGTSLRSASPSIHLVITSASSYSMMENGPCTIARMLLMQSVRQNWTPNSNFKAVHFRIPGQLPSHHFLDPDDPLPIFPLQLKT